MTWFSCAPFVRRSFRMALSLAVMSMLGGAVSAAQAPSLDLSAYRGRVVIVDFWASWCKPCRESLPWLNTMHRQYGNDGLVIVGVNVDANRADAEKFLRDVPVDFDIVYDAQGALATQFAVAGMPASYVFDRSGKLVRTHLGFRSKKREEREAELRQLLEPR